MTTFNAEDELREKMLAFEREQVRLKLRPTLPCDWKSRQLDYSEAKSQEISKKKREARGDIFRSILKVIGDAEALTAKQIGERSGYNTQSAANFLRMMTKNEYVMAVPKVNSSERWVYIKTGKEVKGE